jgi:phosphoglycerate dehydrogenase-like enzyme
MIKIAILDDYQNVALDMADWGSLPSDTRIDVFNDHLSDEAAIAKRLNPYDVLVIMRERTPFPGSLIRQLPSLKLLVTTGKRNLAVDMDSCAERGIVVSGTGSARGGSHPTAELTWGLILALVKQIPEEDRGLRNGRWGTGMGVGLGTKVLGVIGLGNVGSQVARVGTAFGMEVIAWSQNLTDGRAREVGATRTDKDDLFKRSDIVSIHVVLSDRTRGLVDEKALGLMKPTAFLVNTSRGPIVDEKALVDTLANRRLAGAGLDVYGIEPLPIDHPFFTLPNTVLTPHIGYVTRENFEVFYRDSLEDIQAWLAGKPIRTVEP